MVNIKASSQIQEAESFAALGDSSQLVAKSLYDVESSDPESHLVDRSKLSAAEIAQITRLMNSMANLRLAEEELSQASQNFMQLSETEMRAIHYLIVAANKSQIVTPGAIARHLKITSASTTKLLDRLERDGHISRNPHPSDRRALSIGITKKTHATARDTVGRSHATRFLSASKLSTEEREVVIGFLNDVAEQLTSGHDSWGSAEQAN